MGLDATFWKWAGLFAGVWVSAHRDLMTKEISVEAENLFTTNIENYILGGQVFASGAKIGLGF